MTDTGTITAVISGVGLTAIVSWRFFVAFNSKTDKATTNRMFELVDADRKDIAGLSKDMAVMGGEVKHLTTAIDGVGRNVEEILKNGKKGGG